MTGHEYDQHADAPQHANAPQHDPEPTTATTSSKGSEHKMRELGKKFGSTPPTELTATEIQTLGHEIEAVESAANAGNYLPAVIRLNAFWDDWTTAAVEAKIKADSLQKQVCPKYGSRLDQANAYGLLGDDIHEALKELNEQRHKPGHQTWSDIENTDPDIQESLAKALVLTKRHHEHLRQEHT